ncbi:MAG: class I SAM-dependent methyltransferase [Nocardioides sp.]
MARDREEPMTVEKPMSVEEPMTAESVKIRPEVTGIPETLLWTLYYRAQEAARPDGVLRDPLAVELVERIDYPFLERLGQGSGRAQWQGLRARTFDDQVHAFLATHPGATAVALGEGLETQFWRVDDGRVRWIGVDLPEAGELRRRLLPAHERRSQVDASVLDPAWLDTVDASRGVLFTAQGLLMYLERGEVHRLVSRLALRFPGGELVFDGVPRWTSAVTRRQAVSSGGSLHAPPMPWAMDAGEAQALRALPGVARVRRLHPPGGRGLAHRWVLPAMDRLPGLDALVLSIWSARFA